MIRVGCHFEVLDARLERVSLQISLARVLKPDKLIVVSDVTDGGQKL
jgi:hypothetical protein